MARAGSMKSVLNIMPGRQNGFTLIELVIAVLIVGIVTAIAYPSYVASVTKSNRRAAQSCLSNYAQYMERFYTANMRYDVDAGGTDNTLPTVDCASAQNTGEHYVYSIASVSRSAYTLAATPKSGGVQAERDTDCATLTLNQAGTRGAAGATSDSVVAKCW